MKILTLICFEALKAPNNLEKNKKQKIVQINFDHWKEECLALAKKLV
jgi:hypothetical protein